MKVDVNENSGIKLFQKLLSEKMKLIASKLILDKKDEHIYPIKNPPFKIPENWHWCYLSDISIIQEGPGIRKHQYQNKGVQFLTITNILEDSVDLDKSKKYISDSEYKTTYSHFTINKGDIVTACSGGSWGKSAIFDSDRKIILNTSTLRLRFFSDLGNNKYLYYLTKTKYFKDSLSSYVTGQQPNYGYSHYSKIPIPLPPLPEQKRIVAILDECFTAIDKAKANAELNLKNTKELFEKVLNEIFSGIENDKTEIRFEDLIKENQIGLIKSSKEQDCNKRYRYLKMDSISSDNNLLNNKFVYVDATYEELKKFTLDKDDFLFNTRNSYELVGKTCVFTPIDNEPTLYNNNIMRVKFKKGFSSKFINYAFSSNVVKQRLEKLKSGTTSVVGIYYKGLQNLLIPVSNYDSQQTIVHQLDALMAETQKLEMVYNKKIADLEELKKSILQRVFTGELKTDMKEVV